MITKERYEAAKKRVASSKKLWGGRTSLSSAEAKKDPATNDDRNLVEVYEFEHKNTGAAGYFGYWKKNADGSHSITTWMGTPIAEVVFKGETYRTPTFGGPRPGSGQRVNFRARAIDGHTYSGTYFASAGDYVRMKRVKAR